MSFSKRLILNDGTILEDSECGYYERTLGCFIKGLSFGEIYQHFSDPEKFRKVTFDLIYDQHIDRIEYDGFEELISIISRENTIDATIRGDHIEITESRIPINKEDDSSPFPR